MRLSRRLKQVESPNITYVDGDFPIFWERAAGSTVWDEAGRKYLDLTSAFGVASLGHSHPAIYRAILRQSKKLWHGMGDVHPSRIKVEMLEELVRQTPRGLTHSILSSSGAEAVESALKTALLFTGKNGVVAFEGGYHGLTYGALAATHRSDFRKPFNRQIAKFVSHCLYPDPFLGVSEEKSLDDVERVLKTKSIGAIVVEPMQARGGIRIPKSFFLKEVQRLARRYGALLIADEIYTGFGRAGYPFAVDCSGVIPDLLCLGKSLANGYPLSVCIGPKSIMRAWPESDGEAIHTSTYLGNPLGCAMALAAMKEMSRLNVAKRSRIQGDRWLKELRNALLELPAVLEVRGKGLMIGIQLVDGVAGAVIRAALRLGLVILSAGGNRDVIALTPPLTISWPELQMSTEILKKAIQQATMPIHLRGVQRFS